MAYNLTALPPAPYWLGLPRGVEIFVSPCDAVIYETARAKMARIVAGIDQQIADAEGVGARLEGLPDLTDPDRRAGFAHSLFVTALAQAAILDWRGVNLPWPAERADRDKAAAALMRDPAMAEAFMVAYTKPYADLVSEGNASPPAPATPGAGAANTAKAA